jgi:hypothetical protein
MFVGVGNWYELIGCLIVVDVVVDVTFCLDL